VFVLLVSNSESDDQGEALVSFEATDLASGQRIGLDAVASVLAHVSLFGP
jgi:hypothetical protein